MISPSRRLSAVEPYRSPIGARMTPEERQGYLKLDFNEATYPPSPLVAEALQDAALNYYPDMDAQELRQCLARYTGRDIEEIRVWNGSDAALRAICWAYLDEGDVALIREPTYSQFSVFVKQTGATLHAVIGDSAFDASFFMYDICLQYRPKLCYIVNPNNPTGTCYSTEMLTHKIGAYPDTLFVIDEAYYEYGSHTITHHLSQFDNLIVTRTLSKAFGLAGVRVGYTLSSPQIAEVLDKVRNGKDVGVLAQAAAIAALNDIPYMHQRVDEVLRAKTWTVNALRDAGVDVHDAPANFILIQTRRDAAQAVEDFRRRGVLVRDRGYLPQLEGYIRVTIGTMEEMRQFVAVATGCVFYIRGEGANANLGSGMVL